MMTIATSFSGRLFYHTGREALRSMALHYPDDIIAFHEDSYENTNVLSARHICDVDLISNVQYKDLFVEDKELSAIVSYPEYKTSSDYFNLHAPYFFRKVAAVRQAAKIVKQGTLVWLDCDCFVKKPFGDFMKFVQKFDIVHFNRQHMPTETGVLFFNLDNPAVHAMIEKWYDIYRSKEVFTALRQWADTFAFDYVCTKYFPTLSYGKLNSGEGQGLWRDLPKEEGRTREHQSYHNWFYIEHLKSPNAAVRAPIEKPVPENKNRGHLYIGFGAEYDNVAAHSCVRLRQFSNLPIHVLSNLAPTERSKKWAEVNNVTFCYIPYDTNDNRIIKTSLIYYSPFDETLYTDADTVCHSAQFMEVFDLLKTYEIALPVYQKDVHFGNLPKSQTPGFTNALGLIAIPGFNKSVRFTIYGGGVSVFRKTPAVYKFFCLFNEYWEKTGSMRDMPALTITTVVMKDQILIGELPEAYNRIKSSIIQSVHDITKPSPYLPNFVRNHPDDRLKRWIKKVPQI